MTGAQPPADAPVPDAVYGCQSTDCAAEVSYPPDMLRWWEGRYTHEELGVLCLESALPGWWCENCKRASYSDAELEGHLGPTLAEWMERE